VPAEYLPPVRRIGIGFFVAAVGIVGLSPLVLSARASAAPGGEPTIAFPHPRRHRLVEFRIPSTNGYRLRVAAGVRQEFGDVLIEATKGPDFQVLYLTKNLSDDPDQIVARLGKIGEIAVTFHRTGQGREAIPANCRGPKTGVTFGVFRGIVEFEGERGYTQARRDSAGGFIKRRYPRKCRYPPARDGHAASLLTGRYRGKTYVSFDAWKTKLDGAARATVEYEARSTYRTKTFWVERFVTATGVPSDYRWQATHLKNRLFPFLATADATLEPPAPFEGSGVFHFEPGDSIYDGTASWEGSLSVDFPGEGKTPLTGPGGEAELCVLEGCAPGP
jgi:hypothetical protein